MKAIPNVEESAIAAGVSSAADLLLDCSQATAIPVYRSRVGFSAKRVR